MQLLLVALSLFYLIVLTTQDENVDCTVHEVKTPLEEGRMIYIVLQVEPPISSGSDYQFFIGHKNSGDRRGYLFTFFFDSAYLSIVEFKEDPNKKLPFILEQITLEKATRRNAWQNTTTTVKFRIRIEKDRFRVILNDEDHAKSANPHRIHVDTPYSIHLTYNPSVKVKQVTISGNIYPALPWRATFKADCECFAQPHKLLIYVRLTGREFAIRMKDRKGNVPYEMYVEYHRLKTTISSFINGQNITILPPYSIVDYEVNNQVNDYMLVTISNHYIFIDAMYMGKDVLDVNKYPMYQNQTGAEYNFKDLEVEGHVEILDVLYHCHFDFLHKWEDTVGLTSPLECNNSY